MYYTIGLCNLPFKQDRKQVIYVEQAYNVAVNRYIQTNYEAICSKFKSRGYEFCYLPYLAQDLADETVIDYFAPYQAEVWGVSMASNQLLQFMARPENRSKIPASLWYCHDDYATNESLYGETSFRGVSIEDQPYEKSADFSVMLDAIQNDLSNSIRFRAHVQFSIGPEPEEDETSYADKSFPYDSTRLLQEIEERINILKQRGVSLYILEQMIHGPQKISRLVITSDYRILLPDYNNMEISMTPLVKAVYLLFLRHPEGIIFKHLVDYREELMTIYQQLKGDTNSVSLQRSIDDLTDPTKNSINEKCARIREAFISRFDERLAENYIVTGERTTPKRIKLDSELIIWE